MATYEELAHGVLESLSLRPSDRVSTRPVSGHNSSVLLPCVGADDRDYLLKYFIPPEDGKVYPPQIRIEDYARREAALYRFLDSTDADRYLIPAPRTVLIDPVDPPRWLLLEWIPGAVGPADEVLGSDHVFEMLQKLRAIPTEMFLGRRDFPLNRWDVVSYLDRIRLMYDPVLQVIGDRRWRRAQDFYSEAMRWNESRPPVLVHGDFTEQNLVVDREGRPFLIDFERVGIGNPDHDFAWLWIHSDRPQNWKRSLMDRYLGDHVGSDRLRSEWGIRSALVYLAMRRLRFGYLTEGQQDQRAPANLALLDAALSGGSDLFPT